MSAHKAASGTTEATSTNPERQCATCGHAEGYHYGKKTSCVKKQEDATYLNCACKKFVAAVDQPDQPDKPKVALHPLDARLRELAADWDFEAKFNKQISANARQIALLKCAKQLRALLGDAE